MLLMFLRLSLPKYLLHLPNPHNNPLSRPLQRQSRNQRRTNTTSILSPLNRHRIILDIITPVQNLPQRLGSSCFEVRVLREDGTVGSDVT